MDKHHNFVFRNEFDGLGRLGDGGAKDLVSISMEFEFRLTRLLSMTKCDLTMWPRGRRRLLEIPC